MSIEKHKFSDEDILEATMLSKHIWLSVGAGMVELNKPDAIALAKHFKLTKEDLES